MSTTGKARWKLGLALMSAREDRAPDVERQAGVPRPGELRRAIDARAGPLDVARVTQRGGDRVGEHRDVDRAGRSLDPTRVGAESLLENRPAARDDRTAGRERFERRHRRQ